MDNVDIERAAVSAVKSYIDFSSHLRSFIFDNDRTQIWDGDIFVFSGDSKVNDNFYGRVPVQVKGTEVNLFSEKKLSYSGLTREDLNNYRNDGGCILFVVELIRDINIQEFKSRVFYCELSVTFITDLLEKKKNVKQPTLHLLPVPRIDKFQEILMNFSDVRYKNLVIRDIVEIKGLENRIDKLLNVINCIFNEEYKTFFTTYIADIDAMKQEQESVWNAIKKYNDILTSNKTAIVDDVIRAEIELHANYLLSDLYNCESKWMDRLLVMIPEIIKVASDKIDDDLYNLIYDYAEYLWRQKMYHLIGEYFDIALQIARNMTSSSYQSWKVAKVLNTMALYHKDINCYDKAVKEYKETLEILRKLAKDNPDAYMGDVAMTLNNLANLHSDLNRPADAEKEYQEALEIYRRLAKDNPDAYMGYVAMTLNNLANLHSDLNRPADAEKEYQEALEIYRRLAKDNPDAYMGDVAMTLNNLANLHSDLNRPADAEKEYQKALEIRRRLAKDNPDAYMGKVAQTLNNLANLHSDLNRPDEAEKEYQEALEIYRRLAKENPAAYMDDMAMTLNNLALLHKNLNRPDEAEKEYQETLEIRRRLAKDNPVAYLGYMALTLGNLASLHKKLNRHNEAESEYQEALEIYRRLAKDNPDAYMGKVTDTLNQLAYLYASQKDFSKALEAIDEAIAIKPEDAEYYDSKGEILLMKGDEQGAIVMWRKVMELDPDFLLKHNGETELHRQLKEKGLIDE